jgi:cell division protein FtsI (penicillin-binding protein 3)
MNNSRALLIIIIVFAFFILLVYKLADIQIIKSEELKYLAERQQMGIEKIRPERGLIYDRNNVLLVYNKNYYSFYADLRMAKKDERERLAERFSSLFNRPKSHYLNLMNQQPAKNVLLEKKVSVEKAIQLKNLKVKGFFYEEDPTRVYHYNNLASHVVGYLGDNFNGVSGVERFFDKELRGIEGTRLVEKNAIGDMITISEQETKPAVPGDNLYLTIDKSFQSILEEELRKGLSVYGGTSAVGIIMDPGNGEILALTSMNDFNPNEYWKSNDTLRRNKVLTDTYEPGSTFKAVAMAALLDQKLCYPDEVINTENGRYTIKNVKITDTHANSTLTVRGIMEQSSNVGISKLVQRINDDLYFRYLRGFGFGNFTSIGLPGEAKGALKKPTEWSVLTKPFISFGYEISVTPVQLAAAYSAIVNGGVLFQPQIVKRRFDKNSGSFQDVEPVRVRRVISEETSKVMRELLTSIVQNGTGKNAKSKIISIGGKTGTSQKLIEGKYSKSHYNSSFVGFFPAENPKAVCLILVNSPQVGRYGGAVAAPIFKNIAERLANSHYKFFNPPINENEIPAGYKIISTVHSEKERVQPVKEEIIISGTEMPDLTGYNLRDAILILNQLGLKYKVSGTGRVTSQSIPAGESLKNKKSLLIECKEIEISGTVIY